MRRKRQAGFVLVATSVCILAMVGVMGLAIDLGRIYITKNEAQTFTDLAAIDAARELDGTSDGLARAQTRVANSPMKFNMNTQSFSGTLVEFSSNNADWSQNPATATNIRYVRLTADVQNISLFFIPAVVSQTAGRVKARSVAGQMPLSTHTNEGQGALPYAPLAHDLNDPNWGYQVGDELTLRWPNPGGMPNMSNKQCTSCCQADQSPTYWNQYDTLINTLNVKSWRGYIQDNSASAIREAIEDDHIDYTLTLGQVVNLTTGSKATEGDSLENRAAQDTNTTANTYSSYLNSPGNGRRLGVVPIIPASFQGGTTGGGGTGPQTYEIRLVD
ncbi:MAG: hypothetical protein HY013_06320 [Candidatus Solibacter usitatus]|nr:hypothetical protein [Candidatus Solibacter usitatus]